MARRILFVTLLPTKKITCNFFFVFLGFFVCIEKAEKESYSLLLAPVYFVADG